MTADRNSTGAGAPEQPTVTALYGRWKRTLDDFDRTPGLPDGRRIRKLETLEDVERRIAVTRAADLGEVALKLTMLQSGRIAGMSEGRILASALADLRAIEKAAAGGVE